MGSPEDLGEHSIVGVSAERLLNGFQLGFVGISGDLRLLPELDVTWGMSLQPLFFADKESQGA
jgi:hypothetical protein